MHLNALGAAFDACFRTHRSRQRRTGCTVLRRPHTPSTSKDKRWTAAASHSELLCRRISFRPPLVTGMRMAHGAWSAWGTYPYGIPVMTTLRHCGTLSLGQCSVCCWLAYGACMVHELQNCTVAHLGGEMSAEAPARTDALGAHFALGAWLAAGDPGW